MQKLPFFDAPAFSYSVQLGDGVYILRYLYNHRAGRWFMDIETSAGIPIITGVAMVPGYNLIRNYKYQALPPGALIIISNISTHQNTPKISRNSFTNGDYSIFYIDPDDVTELEALEAE